MSESLTEPAKLLLLSALLTNDSIISNNGKAFLKEMILRRDTRAAVLLKRFEVQNSGDSSFLESLHDLIMNEAQSLYNELFFDTSLEVGKTLSKAERDTKCLTNEKSLIYGEVEFNSFYRVLRKINPAPGKVFYDLGSGTGKAVFAARFAYDFSKCVGIEILHGLHTQAVKVLERYNAEFKGQLAMGQSQHAAVYEGSFLDFDWSDGEVVFANSTCFDDALMLSLSQTAERLAPGAIVVTFTKGLSSPAFELLERKRYKMSWGPATVFIQRRLNRDGSSLGPANLNLLPSDDVTYDEDLRNQSIDDIDVGGGHSRGNSGGNGGHGHGHDHTAHDYSSKDSEDEGEEDEEEDEEEEEEDDEDEEGNYGDDIDMYIKQGFDMDPNNEEEEEEESDGEDYEEDEGEEDNSDDEDDGEDGNDSEDTDNNNQTTTHNYNNNNNLINSNSSNSTGYHYHQQQQHQEGGRPGSAPSSQQQHARQAAAAASHASSSAGDDADDRMKVLMDKMAERRKVINDLINGPGSPIAAAAAHRDAAASTSTSHNSSASPASIPRNNTAATPPSAGRTTRSVGIAHSHNNQPATSAFTPPHSPNHNAEASRTPPTHNHANNFGHTITVEAPLSASRGNLTMLNPNLMRSPGPSIPLNLSTSSLNSAAGADSPGNGHSNNVQIHSPLDSALLNRKRATAVGKRVPLSAFPSPFREDF
mmetsp:Transcript_36292/g.62622  ORF Transcript_36292/g.62622 Transcript_36292/m.62622 type:complete len:701 (-) Transcript_36292:44-2146(-)